MTKILTENEESIIKGLSDDLSGLLKKQQSSIEIETLEYDSLRLHKVVGLMEKLVRLTNEANSHMEFTKKKYHNLQFEYMDLQEKYDELLETVGLEE